ncbi:MFS transporter [Candidatus Sordicultor fermentans]|uniref:MFS transporter n=1 Tax=Candidatus Sordicultor fermentans TaxID=1953203 RepID=UPI0016A6DD44|nr:MFS transporter [Atribacterota bacterium]NLY06397.1 MFS transporter [Candidatus Atribacteria bacterium]
MLFLSHFLADFFASFPSPLSPYFIGVYGVDSRTIAMVIATLSLLSSLSQIFFATRPLFQKSEVQFYISLSLLILPWSLIPFSSHIYTLFLILVVAFLANASFHPQGAALSGESGSQGITLFVSGGIAGAALGPIFITWIVSSGGISGIVPLTLGIWICWTILFLIILRKRDYNISSSIPRQKFSLQFFLPLLPIWIMVSIRTFFTDIFHTFVPIYLNFQGYSLVMGGMLLSGGVMSGLLANSIGSRIRTQFNNRLVNLLSFGGLGVAILIFTRAEGIISLTLSYLLADFSSFLSMSTNVCEAQDLFPQHRAFASSVAMGLSWAFGHFLHLLYSSLLGNQVTLVIESAGFFSLGMTVFLLLFPSFFQRKAYCGVESS